MFFLNPKSQAILRAKTVVVVAYMIGLGNLYDLDFNCCNLFLNVRIKSWYWEDTGKYSRPELINYKKNTYYKP